MASTFVSHFNALGESIVTGNVPIAGLNVDSGNLFPKMKDRINETAWELWYFDGGTDDGQTAITISFFRDARTLAEGGFRVQVFVMWPDGTQWKDELVFAESFIAAEGDSLANARVDGVWKDASGSASFTVAADLSMAKLQLAIAGKVTGTLTLQALSGSKAGLPQKEEDAELSPGMYYVRPISLAKVDASLIFETESVQHIGYNSKDENEAVPNITQRKLSFTGGRGGMDRCWSLHSWPQIMTESYFLRATVGPYTMQVIRIISDNATGNIPHTLARLWKDQTLVCAAHRVAHDEAEASSLSDNAILLDKMYEADSDGISVTGNFSDKNTGYTIAFIGKQDGEPQRWQFKVHHKRSWWNMPTSAPGPNATGNSGFLEAISGGGKDEQFAHGCGGGGQVQL